MSANHEVFPVSRAGYLDGWRRRLKYQPGWLVSRYVRPGDTVLDVGAGPDSLRCPARGESVQTGR